MDLDNSEIKARLQSFREGTPDSNDPAFEEALGRVAADPRLAAWFRAEQEFDAVMFRKFRDVPVELDVKERILRGLEQQPPPR